MLGGLHTEMAVWNTLEYVLEGSDWTTAFADVEAAFSGKTESSLKATHLTRTNHAHQIDLTA